jgi:hypothetical protein
LLCKSVTVLLFQLESISFNEDPCIEEFGISVGDKLEEVEARVLDAPQLIYKVSKLNGISYS